MNEFKLTANDIDTLEYFVEKPDHKKAQERMQALAKRMLEAKSQPHPCAGSAPHSDGPD